MHVDPWMWAAFVAFILGMLAVDLLNHRDTEVVSMREAGLWTGLWVSLALTFGGILLWWQGTTIAGEYLAGYLIEYSLSVDNIFVFAVIFSYFGVPREYQHRVLFWGVFGAIVFRAIFIFLGAALLESFEWMIFVFGGFLVLTGVRMAMHDTTEVHPEKNPLLKLLTRALPMTKTYEGHAFFTVQNGKRMATPMLAVLIVIETTDIIFAVDSIPAIFAVTRETFIVFTSNAFAILGLRTMYFLLSGLIDRFHLLRFGLAAVLVFVGIKMLISEIYHMPIWISLTVIAGTLTTSVVASLLRPPPSKEASAKHGDQTGIDERERLAK